MGFLDLYTHPSVPGGPIAAIAHLVLRFMQFILAIAVIGLYAQDLSAAHAHGVYADSNWVYAVVVGSLSAFVALVWLIPKVPWWKGGWMMDLCLLVLWIALFGDFGAKYIHADPQNVGHGDGPGIQRMKNAVWVDLVNLLLWCATGVWGVGMWFTRRRKRTLHTGRAEV